MVPDRPAVPNPNDGAVTLPERACRPSSERMSDAGEARTDADWGRDGGVRRFGEYELGASRDGVPADAMRAHRAEGAHAEQFGVGWLYILKLIP